MPAPASIFTLLFFVPLITVNAILFWLFFVPLVAANAILLWVARGTKRAGIWPTERFFGFRILNSLQLFAVMRHLRQRIRDAEDAGEATRCRRWLYGIYWGYGLGFFALAVFLASTPWLYSQVP